MGVHTHARTHTHVCVRRKLKWKNSLHVLLKLIFCFPCCPFETVAPATSVCVPHTSKTRYSLLWTRLIYLMSLTLVLTSAMCHVMQKIKVPESNVGVCKAKACGAKSVIHTVPNQYVILNNFCTRIGFSQVCIFFYFGSPAHTSMHGSLPHMLYVVGFFPSSYMEHMAETPTHVYLHA